MYDFYLNGQTKELKNLLEVLYHFFSKKNQQFILEFRRFLNGTYPNPYTKYAMFATIGIYVSFVIQVPNVSLSQFMINSYSLACLGRQ